MNGTHLKISVRVSVLEQSDILIAFLSDAGFEGFIQTNDQLEAYISHTQFSAEVTDEIIHRMGLEYSIERVPAKNWNEEWEKNFRPVRVGDFCQIRAGFHPPDPKVTYDLVIQPKMSFGTGHHATTRLMIECMRSLRLSDAVLLDYGTGTGVLAVLAEKMGACSILAVDNDPWSIENARENIETNTCGKITLLLADSAPATSRFSHILANINRNVILNQLHLMAQQLENDGVLIISGVLETDLPVIREAAAASELIENKLLSSESWVAVQYLKH